MLAAQPGAARRRGGVRVCGGSAWVPSNRTTEPAYRDHPVVEQTESVCAILSRMVNTNTKLKIRTLSQTLVELAFGEDKYPALDEGYKLS